jgi:hypothetical protein
VRLASKLSGWEIDIYEVGSDNQPSPALEKPAEAAPTVEAPPPPEETKNVESPS